LAAIVVCTTAAALHRQMMTRSAFDSEVCFEELGELMHVWALSEAAAFSEANPGTVWTLLRVSGARNHAAQFLLKLLTHHGAVQEVGAALTLLDALALKLDSSHASPVLTFEELMEPASLAAIVRLVLKNSTLPLAQRPLFSMVEEHFGLREVLQMDLVTVRELHIVAIMGGRVAEPALPPPGRWLDSVLHRLEVLVALQPEQTDKLELVKQSTKAVLDLLAMCMGMSPVFPPRSLALGCCMLGLVAVGAVSAEEVRPNDVAASDWESLLLLWKGNQGNPSNLANPKQTLSLELELVAKAACCSSNDLQLWAFSAVQGLKDMVPRGLLDAWMPIDAAGTD